MTCLELQQHDQNLILLYHVLCFHTLKSNAYYCSYTPTYVMFLVILYPLIVEMNPNMASYTSELPNKRMVMFLDSIVNHLPLFLRWSLTFVNTNWMSEEYHIVVFSSLSHVEMLSTSFMVTWYISQAYYSYYSSIIIIFIPCTLCVAKWFYHLHWLVD